MTQGTTPSNPKWMTIVGWVLSVLPCFMLFFSAYMKLSRSTEAVDGLKNLHYPDSSLMPIGIAELVCTILYLIPQTAVLGAVLLTGYLGGATATHVIGGVPIHMPVLFGVVLWFGLFFRDGRIRALLPLRR
jgi:Mn2+/Fe2+ NRAMP family transporter